MPLRKINLPKDFPIIGDIALEAFHYPDNPEWSVQSDEREGLLNAIKSFRRLWPLMNFFQIFSPSLRDLMVGYIWEEEGQPAGLILMQRRGASYNWIITTVGVLPQFRRRGIARKLVLAGLEMIKERGGKVVFLGVISGNLPAFSLYKDVGFEKYSSDIQLEYKPSTSIPHPELPHEYTMESLSPSNWKIPYELEKRVAPENTQKYEPVEIARYKRPFILFALIKLLDMAQGIHTSRFCIRKYDTGEVVGRGMYEKRSRSGGRHTLFQRLNPQHTGLAPFFIEYMLHDITNPLTDHVIEAEIPEWQGHLLDPLLAEGFKKRVEFYRMGMEL
ncbi:MAG: GNAT family N-acetyltransferase [Anaerolineales bacterium]|jgi:ribosomal protein S18 acetylase RimI-like enzyme